VSKHVLIVDDSQLMLDMARHALEGAGYRVSCARDLGELERGRAGEIDLILMDVQMPEAYGDDVAGVLRGVHGVRVPIYLLSALPAADLGERARGAEVDGFIPKQGGMPALVERVRTILGAP